MESLGACSSGCLGLRVPDFPGWVEEVRIAPPSSAADKIGLASPDLPDLPEPVPRACGLEQASVAARPRLLSDKGSSDISGDLAEWLNDRDMRHTRRAPCHPMTQGKIERCHRTLKNRILSEN